MNKFKEGTLVKIHGDTETVWKITKSIAQDENNKGGFYHVVKIGVPNLYIKITDDDIKQTVDTRPQATGKIRFTSFENARNIQSELDELFDIKLHITLYQNKGILKGFIAVPQLAPSKKLFDKTMYRWKKLKFTDAERELLKNGETGTWMDLYKAEFIEEMNTREDFKKAYARIKQHLKNNKRIIAICYCDDEDKCHRKIVSDSLKSEGFDSECF